MPTKKSRVLRFAVSTALVGVGPFALAACGGGDAHVNEREPEPIHVNEPAEDPPIEDTVNEPEPDEPTDDPDGPTTNEPAPDEG